MPQRLAAQTTVAENLCELARTFKSGDPAQAAVIKREFKDQSKNDIVRAVVYLMEVVGSRDVQYKTLVDENKDLKELLKLNNISLEDKDEGNTAPGTEGSNGVAAAGAAQNIGSEGTQTSSVGGESAETSANAN
jgi:hypothetical protein